MRDQLPLSLSEAYGRADRAMFWRRVSAIAAVLAALAVIEMLLAHLLFSY